MKTELQLTNECYNKLEKFYKNPIIKLYLNQRVKEHVDFEIMLEGNTNALIGDWKHNCVGDLVTYIHAPKNAKVAFKHLIEEYGEQILFETIRRFSLRVLKEKQP